MTAKRERELMAAIGQVADGFQHGEVVSACGNIMLNVIRQEHGTLASAEERLGEVVANMRTELRATHYHPDGTRNDRRIIIPSLRELAD